MPTEYQLHQRESRRLRLLALIDRELENATSHFDRFHSPHEGLAVIWEEFDELKKHVWENTGRSREAMVEAIQIAAMALRYIYDLGAEPIPEEEDALRDYVERFKRVSG